MQGGGSSADQVGQGDDWALLAGRAKVIDERQVLGDQGVGDDVERVLEQHDGGELRRVHQVQDGRR